MKTAHDDGAKTLVSPKIKTIHSKIQDLSVSWNFSGAESLTIFDRATFLGKVRDLKKSAREIWAGSPAFDISKRGHVLRIGCPV